jgi:type I restriction enzyme S subunit
MATPTTKSTDVTSGYKQTEAGVIPEEWDVQTLSAVSSMKSGQGITASRIDQHSQYPCYGGNGLRGFTSTYTHDGEFALIGRQGALCGNVVGVQGKLFASEHAVVVTPRQGTSIRFLTYVLGDMQLNRLSEASAQPGLSVSKILQLSIALPKSEHEQHAIAAALSDVDELLGSLDRLIAKKRDLKKAAMQQLLTGKKRLPGFKREWEIKQLGKLADLRSGGTPSTTEPKYWDGNIPWCTPTDITALKGRKYLTETSRRITENGLKASSAEMIPANSIVMTSRATIGECAINKVSLSTNQGFKNFIPHQQVDVNFLYYLLITHKQGFIGLCSGSTFLEISKGQLMAYAVRLPAEKGEQTAIAEVLSDMDSEIEALEAKLAKARQIKQGMMQELLTGRIRLV